MNNWLLRGLAFAAAMVGVRLVQGVLIDTFESMTGLISAVLLLLFVIGVVVWGFLDGRSDATANPDPDRRQDLAMTWLIAGLVAGVVSGAVAWLVAQLDKALYHGSLINELSTFAAFTALLVFGPAMAGVVAGHWLVDRNLAKLPQRHHGLAADGEERGDADVFAAVTVGAPPATADADASAAAAALSGETAVAGLPTEEFPLVTTEQTAVTEEFPLPTELPTEQAAVTEDASEAGESDATPGDASS